MRPFLEIIPWTEDSSLAHLNRRLEQEIPFQWHHHPEWELTLTLNSVGQRFVGDHVGQYGDGDLALVGPNLPHTWMSRERLAEGPHRALVIWFRQDWAAQVAGLPEARALGSLLARGARGLAFSEAAAAAARPLIEAFFTADAPAQLMLILRIFAILGGDNAALPLASASAPAVVAGGRDRIDRVLTHIHTHFDRPLTVDELAEVAALSPSGLNRMFQRHVGRTISDYIIALRIGAAAARLAQGDAPIAHIAAEVGYGALANFNRQFRAAKGMTPRAYRKRFRDGA